MRCGVGQPFPHGECLSQLAGLCDQLKTGLSEAEPKEDKRTVADLAERIKALRAANTIEATPERTAARRVSAEEPVVARIMRRQEEPGTVANGAEVRANGVNARHAV